MLALGNFCNDFYFTLTDELRLRALRLLGDAAADLGLPNQDMGEPWTLGADGVRGVPSSAPRFLAPRHDADAMPPIPAVMPGVDHVDAPCVLLSLGAMSSAGRPFRAPKNPCVLLTDTASAFISMLGAFAGMRGCAHPSADVIEPPPLFSGQRACCGTHSQGLPCSLPRHVSHMLSGKLFLSRCRVVG